MKIAMFASGQSFHACRWANALSEKGVEVHFISVIKFARPLNSKVKQYYVESRFNKAKYFTGIFKARDLLQEIKPDLVHAHYSSGNGIWAKLALFRSKTPFITSLYGAEVFEFPYKSIVHKLLLKFVVERANVVLSTSKVMALEYAKLFPKLPLPLVTPFGVDIEKFSPIRSSKTKEHFTIGLVKKLEDKYGVDILLRAISILRLEYNIDCVLRIVGGGTKRTILEELVRELDISDLVIFEGWLDNDQVPTFLSEIDLFVVPSRFQSESFGVAAVEAMSCGLPVIVSNVGGLPEVVEDGVSGLVFESENYCELADKILYLIQNDLPRQEVIIGARKRVEELYDWRNSVELMLSIYQNQVKNK
ncbi:putative Glycosyl transferase group 1 [Vibrio coralliirubri]|uniref:glycosyltransferase n=1 Tax=Vibrio coralliirubri TaxID=1516159 RepID=UPI000635DF8F|nr:glycosyltransferase [Vibrio coralliirubri]CDT99992.1 putative Glycosyl transferase group 1 [Vibrio coralliirubri]